MQSTLGPVVALRHDRYEAVAGASPRATPELVAFLNRATGFYRAAFGDDGPRVRFTFQVSETDAWPVDLDVGGSSRRWTRANAGEAVPMVWSGGSMGLRWGAHSIKEDGPWSLFRLLDKGTFSPQAAATTEWRMGSLRALVGFDGTTALLPAAREALVQCPPVAVR